MTPDPTGPDEREALDYTDIANRVQAETGRSIWPSTVEAVVKHLPSPRLVTVSEDLADHIRDARLIECEHYVTSLDREPCCSPCLRDRLLPHLSSGQSEAYRGSIPDRHVQNMADDIADRLSLDRHGREVAAEVMSHYLVNEYTEAERDEYREAVRAFLVEWDASSDPQFWEPVESLRTLLHDAPTTDERRNES